jgi:HSP20 family molecular chaperone IbpA
MNDLLDVLATQFLGFNPHRGQRLLETSTFPPLNVYREKQDFSTGQGKGDIFIELALSGYTPEHIDVALERVDGYKMLTITSKNQNSYVNDNDVIYMSRGLAGRSFTKSFALSDEVEVVSAEMKNGLLTIRLSVAPMVRDVTHIPINYQTQDLLPSSEKQALPNPDKITDNNSQRERPREKKYKLPV